LFCFLFVLLFLFPGGRSAVKWLTGDSRNRTPAGSGRSSTPFSSMVVG
jgi:hypothetical protein